MISESLFTPKIMELDVRLITVCGRFWLKCSRLKLVFLNVFQQLCLNSTTETNRSLGQEIHLILKPFLEGFCLCTGNVLSVTVGIMFIVVLCFLAIGINYLLFCHWFSNERRQAYLASESRSSSLLSWKLSKIRGSFKDLCQNASLKRFATVELIRHLGSCCLYFAHHFRSGSEQNNLVCWARGLAGAGHWACSWSGEQLTSIRFLWEKVTECCPSYHLRQFCIHKGGT